MVPTTLFKSVRSSSHEQACTNMFKSVRLSSHQPVRTSLSTHWSSWELNQHVRASQLNHIEACHVQAVCFYVCTRITILRKNALFLQLDSLYPWLSFCFKCKVSLMVMMLVNWWLKVRRTRRCMDTVSSISQEWRWQIVWDTAWPTVFACRFKYVATYPNASCALAINI